jgi:hypothetical protein
MSNNVPSVTYSDTKQKHAGNASDNHKPKETELAHHQTPHQQALEETKNVFVAEERDTSQRNVSAKNTKMEDH